LFNLNFNYSFNQTPIFLNKPQLKVLFIKQLFSNHNHNSYRNTKHTLTLDRDFFNFSYEKNKKYDFNREFVNWDRLLLPFLIISMKKKILLAYLTHSMRLIFFHRTILKLHHSYKLNVFRWVIIRHFKNVFFLLLH
jgi:hypothetical protein